MKCSTYACRVWGARYDESKQPPTLLEWLSRWVAAPNKNPPTHAQSKDIKGTYLYFVLVWSYFAYISYNTIPSCLPPRVPSCCRSSRPSRHVFHLGPSPFAVYCNARQNKPSYLFVSIADSRSVFIFFTSSLSIHLSIHPSTYLSLAFKTILPFPEHNISAIFIG